MDVSHARTDPRTAITLGMRDQRPPPRERSGVEDVVHHRVGPARPAGVRSNVEDRDAEGVVRAVDGDGESAGIHPHRPVALLGVVRVGVTVEHVVVVAAVDEGVDDDRARAVGDGDVDGVLLVPNESVPASPRYVPNDSTVDWTAHSPSLLPRAA